MSEEQLAGRLSVCELRLSVQQSHVPGLKLKRVVLIQDSEDEKYIWTQDIAERRN